MWAWSSSTVEDPDTVNMSSIFRIVRFPQTPMYHEPLMLPQATWLYVCVVSLCPPRSTRLPGEVVAPGLTRGMATLNRVCERGIRRTSRA